MPLRVWMRLRVARMRSASRTVVRETPKSRASSASDGRRSPGESSPAVIIASSWSATCSYALRMRCTRMGRVFPAITGC